MTHAHRGIETDMTHAHRGKETDMQTGGKLKLQFCTEKKTKNS